MAITRRNNYFEDLAVGQRQRHPRGRTVMEWDNVALTHLTMNTAEAHFNEDLMQKLPPDSPFPHTRVVVGLLTLSLVAGLASEEVAENALAELGFDKVRMMAPVLHGHTLYAESEVLEKRDAPDRPDAGIVRLLLRGINQDEKVVMEAEWTLLVKRKAHWLDRDAAFKPFLKPPKRS